jgi:dCMP deaminase
MILKQKEKMVDLEVPAYSKQDKLDRVFMNIAKEVATLSHCSRSKVGAVIELDGNVVSFGFNGTPKGTPNCCEDDNNTTLPYVIHGESNALLKAAKTGHSTKGGTLYLTLSPCLDCAKLILQSEIKRVVYLEEYRDPTAIHFLSQFINIEKYEQSNI